MTTKTAFNYSHTIGFLSNRYKGFQNPVDVFLDHRLDAREVAEVDLAVAVVHDGKAFQRIEIPRPGSRPADDRTGRPNCARSEARARTVAGRGVERNTGGRDIHSGEITGVLAAHEAQRTTVGRRMLDRAA